MHKGIFDIVNDDESGHEKLIEAYKDKYFNLKKQYNKSIVSKVINKITSLKCNICVTTTIVVLSIVPVIYFSIKPDDKKNFFCQLSLVGSSILQIFYTCFATMLRTNGSYRDVKLHVVAFEYACDKKYVIYPENHINSVKIYIKNQFYQHKNITIVAYIASLARMLFLSLPFFAAKNVDDKYRVVVLGAFILSNHILIQTNTACDIYAASRALQKNDNIKAAIKRIDILCLSKNNEPNKKKYICTKKLITIFVINIATSLSCTIFSVVTAVSFLNNLNIVTPYNGSLISNNESLASDNFPHHNTSVACMKLEEDASFLRSIFCSQELLSTMLIFAFQGFIRVGTVTALSSKNKRACKLVVINVVRYSINTVLLTINAVIGNKNLVPEIIGACVSATVTISNSIENILFKHSSDEKKDDKMIASVEDLECKGENEQSKKFSFDVNNSFNEEQSNIKKSNFFIRFIECFTHIRSTTTLDECSDLSTKIYASSTKAEQRLIKNSNSALTII